MAKVWRQLRVDETKCTFVSVFPFAPTAASTKSTSPEMASSTVGLINTLINVYSVRDGYWSVTAKVALAMNVLSLAVMVMSFLEYDYQVVNKVQHSWRRGMEQV